jgi:hypothetical protein
VEHVERQDEREQELRADADKLDEQGDALEERGQQLEQRVGEVRDEWEGRQRSEDVPGAQEPGAGPSGSGPPVEADIAPGDDDDFAEGKEGAPEEDE